MILSEKLNEVIKKINDEKLDLLLKSVNDQYDFISYNANGLITFLDIRNYGKEYAWIDKAKTEIKLGRFLLKISELSKIEISNHEIEIIGNKFKSIFDETKYLLLEEVSGSDIIKWYHYTKYSQNRGIMRGSGTLNSSCSGHAKNINMYEDNKDKVKLIILYENSSKEKISGRALLWNIDEPSIKYMDRIYTVNDSDVYLFQNYAKEKGYHYRSHNIALCNSGNKFEIVSPDEIKSDFTMKVNLSKFDYKGYPYIDSIKYLNMKEGYLSNKVLNENLSEWRELAMYGGRGGYIELNGRREIKPEIDPYEGL